MSTYLKIYSRLVLTLLLVAATARPAFAQAQTAEQVLEELRARIVEYQVPSTITLYATAGATLQASIDAAVMVSARNPVVLMLDVGDHVGNFVLPARASTTLITITGNPATLPAPGTRIDLRWAGTLPRLVSATGYTTLATAPGAHDYLIRGLEFAPLAKAEQDLIVCDGDAAGGALKDRAQQPARIAFDQNIIRGDVVRGLHRAIRAHCADLVITRNHIDRVHEFGRDSQGIAAWNTTGPLTIVDNYISASGENILLGGGPAHLGVVPADITITRNTVTKDLAWHTPRLAYLAALAAGDKALAAAIAPTIPQVKNLIEIKFGTRILIADNLLENVWSHAQTGFAVLFTVQKNSGAATLEPFLEVSDVTFTNNVVRNVGSALSINAEAGPARDIRIVNNAFTLDRVRNGADGFFAEVGTGVANLRLSHNTVDGVTGNKFLSLYVTKAGPTLPGFVFDHNVVRESTYGLFLGGGAQGAAALAQVAPGAVFVDNAIYRGPNTVVYPPGNYRVSASTPGSALAGLVTSDGRPPGVDVATLPR